MAREVKRDYLDKGLVRFIYVDFPVVRGELSVIIAEASHCVGEQGQFWAYHERLFEATSEPGFDREGMIALAGEMGMDTEALTRCLDEQRYRPIVAEEYRLGRDLGVEGTPTFFINTQRIPGFVPYETMKQVIDEELAKARGTP